MEEGARGHRPSAVRVSVSFVLPLISLTNIFLHNCFETIVLGFSNGAFAWNFSNKQDYKTNPTQVCIKDFVKRVTKRTS